MASVTRKLTLTCRRADLRGWVAPSSAQMAWLVALLLGGCDAERRAYTEAGLLHRRSIAHIAAFSAFLQPPRQGPPGAAWRHGARIARLEIVSRAAAAQEQRALPGQPSTPASRIAQALAALLSRCALSPNEDVAAERRQAVACLEEVGRANLVLRREDDRAAGHGLPPGTIPLIAAASITQEAREAAAALAQRIQPPPAELVRRQLWEDAGVEPSRLLQACDAAVAQARQWVPGAEAEIEVFCTPLREGERLLREHSSCAGQGPCAGRSLCGMLGALAQRNELPASYRQRLIEGERRCMERLAAHTEAPQEEHHR